MLHHGHNDSVTSPNVVQQKIRIWVEGFVSQRFGNGMRASVDLSACGCCGQCAHMALGAANLVKQLGPFLGSLAVRQLRVASRSFGGADEAGKMVNIVQAVRTRFSGGTPCIVSEPVRPTFRRQPPLQNRLPERPKTPVWCGCSR